MAALVATSLALAVVPATAAGAAGPAQLGGPAATSAGAQVVPISRISPYRFVRVRGIRMGYRTLGRGRPLVLVTGFGVTLAEWYPRLLERLAAFRQVIVLDNRGAGTSTNPSGASITVPGMADDTAALIRALGHREADVLGWSMGGYVAQELALRHPSLVRRMVLASTDPGGARAFQPSPRIIRILADPSTSPTELMQEALYPRPAWPLGDEWLESLGTTPGLLPDSFTVSARTLAQQARATGPLWDAAGRGTLRRLKDIVQPTLVAHGRRDVVVPPMNALLLENRLPIVRRVAYGGAGHAFLFQESGRFSRAVRTFLQEPRIQPRGRARERPLALTGGSRLR